MYRWIKIFLILILIQPFSNYAKETENKEESKFKQLDFFNKALYMVESQYYREINVDKLIEGAIKGMLETLDPHSSYLGEEMFEKMKSETSGEFGGLGIEVTQKEGEIVVISPIEDTPAYKAGIKSGDVIVEIDHDSTLGLTLEESVKKMKGPANSDILLGIRRKGESSILQFKLTREIIRITPVKAYDIGDNYILVRLIQFQKDSAKSIRKKIKKLREKIRKKSKSEVQGIILDLRSNPGGLLDEAIEVASIFLNEGVVVSTEGRDPSNREVRYVSQVGKKELSVPLVVLINGASASASEIVAGCLQDHKRAIIMGGQSFGKGSVQTVAKIDENKGIKLTIAQYMTPLNRKIQAFGIKPDISLDEVDGRWIQDHKADDNYIRERDLRNHLNATIETEDEKTERIKHENELRKKRIQSIKEREKAKKGEKEEQSIFQKYMPEEDLQVAQAINYLKSYYIFKTIGPKFKQAIQ